ncbi:transcription repressor OFP15-like [Curcuma longa]|uniref:transcription repressor OFP15-like n=1 Tax=Curcuma longa TaxID=136217 RepID=UPI003D9F4EDB
MGRKLGFTSSFFSRILKHSTSSSSPCTQPKTLSFRLEHDSDDCAFFDLAESSPCLSEVVAGGLKSERLFFEPGTTATSSVLQSALEGSVAMEVESDDPYEDFKRSMEEMVMAHGVRDWAWLEEMLRWYLKANAKSTHEVIVAAFMELLWSFIASSSSSSSSSRSSVLDIEEEEKRETVVNLV